MKTRAPYDGMIMAATSYANEKGRYWRISYFARVEGYAGLLQSDARAIDYVERYGIEIAVKNAAEYDPDFDILKDLENSRKPSEEEGTKEAP